MIFNMDIPLEYIGLAALFILAMFFGLVYFGNYYMDIRSRHPELHILQKARKPPFPPVIAMVDPSDKIMFFNGELEKKTDIKLSRKDFGLLLDPHQVTKMPKSRFEDGTGIFLYGTGFHFPTSPNGARTIVQFVNKIRKEYPKLNFIRDDIVLIELFTKSGNELRNDISSILKMYPLEKPIIEPDLSPIPEEFNTLTQEEQANYFIEKGERETALTVDTIAELVEEIKGKIKGWKPTPGYFSMNEGIALLPIGTMSSDMTRLETVTKMNTANDLMKEPDPWMNTLKFVALIGGGLLLAWMIISAMKPGA